MKEIIEEEKINNNNKDESTTCHNETSHFDCHRSVRHWHKA